MDYLSKPTLEIARRIRNAESSSLEEVLAEIRCGLQFTTTPTQESMNNGFVDCVGASIVTKNILEQFNFEGICYVALVNEMPWNTGAYANNKHCIVIRILEDKNLLQLIDPTPINGYGYGRISKILNLNEWESQGPRFCFKNKEVRQWNDYLYPSFTIIDREEIEKILGVSQMKSALCLGKGVTLIEPPVSPVWKMEYYRVLAKSDPESSAEHINKAIECGIDDPYMLEEAISIFDERKYPEKLLKELTSRKKESVKALVSANKLACKEWEIHFMNAYQSKNWEQCIYYLGCIFWRKQSTAQLLKKPTKRIQMITHEEQEIPLFKLSPEWFTKNDLKIAISTHHQDASLISIPYRVSEINHIAVKAFELEDIPRAGWLCVLESKQETIQSREFFGKEAHIALFSVIAPELLII